MKKKESVLSEETKEQAAAGKDPKLARAAMNILDSFSSRQRMYEDDSADDLQAYAYMRSGCLPFDLVTGGKGQPRGRMTLLYSEPGVGKTTLLFTAARGYCQAGYKVVYADLEASDDTAYAMGLIGPDDHLEVPKGSFKYLTLSTYAELEVVGDAFVDSDFDILMVDSITAATISRDGRKKNGKTIEDASAIGADARVQSNWIRAIAPQIKGSNQALIYIAQIRNKIDFRNPQNNGPKAAVSNAGLFFSNLQIKVFGSSLLKDNTRVIGRMAYLYAEKNRHAMPFVRIPAKVFFGRGVSNIDVLEKLGEWKGLFVQRGAYWDVCVPGQEPVKVRGTVGRNNWIKENYESLVSAFYEYAPGLLEYIANGEKEVASTAEAVLGKGIGGPQKSQQEYDAGDSVETDEEGNPVPSASEEVSSDEVDSSLVEGDSVVHLD